MSRVIEITDFLAPELDVYARATENQLVNRADPSNALFIAESPLVIGRALDAGCVPVSFLMEPQHITGKGAEVLRDIDMVGNNLKRAQGMCGSKSGSIPTDVGQPMIRVSSMTVGGRG